MEKKASFSYSINHLIGFVFGIAFLVIFFSYGILLYLSEENSTVFYWKILAIFLVFLVLYAIAAIYTSAKIRKMFEPLDHIALALAEDKIRIYGDTTDLEAFANQLSAQMEEMSDMSEELTSTKDNLNDIYQESEESRSKFDHQARRGKINLDNIEKSCKVLIKQTDDINRILDACGSVETKLKFSRQSLNEDSESVKNSLNECSRFNQEMLEERERIKGTYDVLNDMQKESMELIDTVYNEITYLQDLLSKLDLCATSVPLEYVRHGGLNVNITGTMDEIRHIDRRLRDKIDELAMLVIRAKNAEKLANDQTEHCMEIDEEGRESIRQADERMVIVTAKLQGLLEINEEISGGISSLLNNFYELSGLAKQQDKELQFIDSEAGKLNYRMGEMEQIVLLKEELK